MSPDLSRFPSSEPLKFNRQIAVEPPRHTVAAAETLPVPERPQGAAPDLPEIVHLARGGTVHMQDHIPFKAATTRFPPRKPLATQQVGSTGDEAEVGSMRPFTLYLADHNPHLVAPAPTVPIARPHYTNGLSYLEGREGEGEHSGFEDVELKKLPHRSESLGSDGGFHAQSPHLRNPMSGDWDGKDVEIQGRMRTKEEDKAGNRNCLIGWVLILALVVAITGVAVLVYLVNKPGKGAG
ncbi:MAG: hypothetical protein ASARMPRED_003422 [Alectoria sarmentosa]|nr:MAG: hypothetical protein ASARMPRED_003422 [Alectoria sarmentosa]